MDRQVNATESVITPDLIGRSRHRAGSVVRRRRARGSRSGRRWVAARSYRRMVRNVVVCTGVLLLMALGLYLGLARQDQGSPVGGSERGGVTGPRGMV